MREGDRPAGDGIPASAVAAGPTPLRGREHELGLIEGHLADLARGHGVRVLSAAGDPDGQLVPLAPLLHALTADDPPMLTADDVRGLPTSAASASGCCSSCRSTSSCSGGGAAGRVVLLVGDRLEPGRGIPGRVLGGDHGAGARYPEAMERLIDW